MNALRTLRSAVRQVASVRQARFQPAPHARAIDVKRAATPSSQHRGGSRQVHSKASADSVGGSGGAGKLGGGGGGGSGGSGGAGKGGSDDMGSSGAGGLWAAYMRLMDSNPFLTKVITSAALNGVGDMMGQLLFERGKAFDWQRLAKFVFLGGALVAPVLGFWYAQLNVLVPAATMAGAMGRLFLDQALFAPCFVAMFLSSLLVLNGTPELIIPKLKQDLCSTVSANWALWLPGQFINFRYVPPQFNLLFSNIIALVWSTYLSWAGSRQVQDSPPLTPKSSLRASK